MFLPVNCLFIAAVTLLLAVIIVYTGVRSFETRGESLFGGASRTRPRLLSGAEEKKPRGDPASAVMKGGILQIDGEEVVAFSWTAGGGVICKGPHSSMSRTRSSWLF